MHTFLISLGVFALAAASMSIGFAVGKLVGANREIDNCKQLLAEDRKRREQLELELRAVTAELNALDSVRR